MPVHLIIDGYNLIRQSPQLQLLDAVELQSGREALLALLVRYREHSSHKITVVFDGWQGGEPQETRGRHQGVGIIYSRRGERADEVIKRLLTRERTRAVVVTSDREIQEWAERVDAVWIGAGQFEALHLHCAEETAAYDSSALAKAPAAKKGPARRLSKRRRHQQQKLKKL